MGPMGIPTLTVALLPALLGLGGSPSSARILEPATSTERVMVVIAKSVRPDSSSASPGPGAGTATALHAFSSMSAVSSQSNLSEAVPAGKSSQHSAGGKETRLSDEQRVGRLWRGAEEGEEEEGEEGPAPPFGKRKFGAGGRVQSLFADFQQAVQKYLEDRSVRHESRGTEHDKEELPSASPSPSPPPAGQTPPDWSEDVLRASLRVLVRCRQGLRGPREDGDLLPRMRECLRGRMLAAMDSLIASEDIPLGGGARLVRKLSPRSPRGGMPLDMGPPQDADDPDGDDDDATLERPLAPRLLSKLGELLSTHDLQLNYGQDAASVQEGRRRHHYRKVFPVLVTGFMILISLMVPLGFQFMAMIGGKALLMSKMALVMASMYNLRRSNLPLAQQHGPAPTYHVSSSHVPHIIDHVGPYHER